MKKEDFSTPGQLIKTLLDYRGWTQRVLAVILGIDETGINHVISGKRPVTAEMAIMLGEIFELPAENFLDIQKAYDLAKARITTRPDPERSMRAHIFGDLPVTEMIKRRWLDVDDLRDIPKVEAELAKFFGVDSINEIEILPHVAKKTHTFAPISAAQLAWVYRVREIASEMIVGRYSPSSVKNAVTLLHDLLLSPEEARKVPRILAEAGVRFVIVETLSSAKVDGVCFWLNDFAPVIGMSLRYDRVDNFWFVLRHEIEHVLRHHGRSAMMVDTELEGERAGVGHNISEEERTANEAATDFCVPQKTMDSFMARKAPFFNELDIIGLARTLQIHPGLIAGQIQHRTGRYDRFRQHLAKVRSVVIPNAMVDGWGNVAPVGL